MDNILLYMIYAALFLFIFGLLGVCEYVIQRVMNTHKNRHWFTGE